MATTILSGRSLVLTIATKDYSEQILDSAINFDTERLTFDTLAGKAYKYIDSNVTLDINFFDFILITFLSVIRFKFLCRTQTIKCYHVF